MSNPLNLKHGASHYGRFYPLHYVVGIFAEPADRDRAVRQLKLLNWLDADLIAVSGRELVELRNDIRENRSLWESFVSKFANRDRVMDQIEKDDYSALLIYAPDSEKREAVRKVLENTAVLAQAYDSMSFSQLPLEHQEHV